MHVCIYIYKNAYCFSYCSTQQRWLPLLLHSTHIVAHSAPVKNHIVVHIAPQGCPIAWHGTWRGLGRGTPAPPNHPGVCFYCPFGAFKAGSLRSHIVNHDHPRANPRQSPPPGGRKLPFGTVWSVFGVRQRSILVHRGDQDFRVFDPQGPGFVPPGGGCCGGWYPPARGGGIANPPRGAF